MKEMIKFDMPKNQSSIIKVIGVGGGGSNAVNHMFRQGIKGVDFIICNTDAQAMEMSPVPVKIQLGEKGLGAGSIPAVGKESARQKMSEIRDILEKNTKMLFITAGMGGGTGTGAAPVIAAIAKELDILTVGIVTLPFSFEGRKRKLQAEEGIRELRNYVDTLLIICNDKIRELYGDLKLSDAFHKADDVLTTAAKGIAEIITVTGYINVDFEDVKTVMKGSGRAIMGCAAAESENRAVEAVKAALASPLLNDNEIDGASNVLLYITSGSEEISMDEVTEITDYIQREAKSQAEIIWGNGFDESLGNKISITLIATGFDSEKKRAEAAENKILHTLDEVVTNEVQLMPPVSDDERIDIDRIELITKKSPSLVMKEEQLESSQEIDADRITLIRKTSSNNPHEEEAFTQADETPDERTFVFDIGQAPDQAPETNDEEVPAPNGKPYFENKKSDEEPDKKPFEVYIKKPTEESANIVQPETDRPVADLRSLERIERLRNLSLKLKNDNDIAKLENEPAYVRRNVEINNTAPSSESEVSRYSLYEEGGTDRVELRSENSFLHDNVD